MVFMSEIWHYYCILIRDPVKENYAQQKETLKIYSPLAISNYHNMLQKET
jgi:hypothetical protein